MPVSSVMPAAEAKLKLARSRYAGLYVINTIGMMYHQRFVAFVELFIGLPLSMRETYVRRNGRCCAALQVGYRTAVIVA